MAVLALVLCSLGLTWKAEAAFSANGSPSAPTQESCPNGVIDPGETVTVSFPVKNTSGGDINNATFTINQTDGVSAPQSFSGGTATTASATSVNFGTITKDSTVSVSLTFRANGPCGGTITPTLHVTFKGGAEDIAFGNIQLGATTPTTQTFSNANPITINDFNPASNNLGRATPYPSTISVTGVPHSTGLTGNQVTKVTASITNLIHSWSPDVQILLVGPQGQKVVLMNDAGGQTTSTAPVNNVTLTFDDSAATGLPFNGQIVSGTFKPTNFTPSENFADVPGPYSSALSVFNTSLSNANPDPNGTWSLYVQDDTTGNSGQIAGGWSLSITTTQVVCCGVGQTFPEIQLTSTSNIQEDQQNATIASFNVNDLETSASSLAIVARSGDQTKVTDANLVVQGSGASRTLLLKSPVLHAFGTVPITLTVTDADNHRTSTQFTLTINFIDFPPTVSAIRNQSANIGSPTASIPFLVSDVEDDGNPANYTFNNTSDNQAVVPNNNIQITAVGPDGNGNAQFTVQVFPFNTSTSGQANITITAIDRAGKTGSSAFLVAFNTQPGFPTITPISNQVVNENHADTAPPNSVSVPFSVHSGSTTPDANVQVTAASSNTTLLPTANIVFGGSGSERSVTMTPAVNQSGSVTVTITATDPNTGRSTSTSFVLTINFVNNNPTISGIPDQTINENGATGTITFTVGDVETPAANLTVTAASSNPTLVPNDAAHLTLGGSGANRTLVVTPAANQFGKAGITVTVTDANGGTANALFAAFVNAVNQPPILGAINGVAFANNATDAPTAATVVEDSGDITLPLTGVFPGPPNESNQSVTLTVNSINGASGSSGTLAPKSITQPNSSGNATIVLTPSTHAFGSFVVNITATDNGAAVMGGANVNQSITRQFTVVISPINHPPSISFPSGNVTTPKNVDITVPMSISDVETTSSNMTVTATSSNPNIVANTFGSIVAGGGNTTLTVHPQTDVIGQTTITVTVTDRGPLDNGTGPLLSATSSFVLTVANIFPPTISISPTSKTINENGVASATLTVSGQGNIRLSGSAIEKGLVPDGNIFFNPTTVSGTNATSTLVVVPAANQSGTAHITITATDGNSPPQQASVQFTLTVTFVEQPPTLTFNGALTSGTITTKENTATADSSTGSKLLEFTVADPDDTAAQLNITATSSNTTLVPNDAAHIAIGTPDAGNPFRKSLTITPATDKFGTTAITVSVTDKGGLNVQQSFTLNVLQVNSAPTIDNIGDVTASENSGQVTVNLTGITVGPAASDAGQSITVTATAKDSGASSGPSTIITAPVVTYTSPNATGKITFTPQSNGSGTAVVTVTVQDNGGTANGGSDTTTKSFNVKVLFVNQTPTISIPSGSTNITIITNTSTPVIPITVGDLETPATQLTLSASVVNTSNPNLLSSGSFTFSGSSTSRGLIITPNANQSGTAQVRVTVTDSGPADEGVAGAPPNKSASADVFLTVQIPPEAPQISPNPIPDQVVPPNGFSSVINFTISDNNTAPSGLQVSATSSNPTLIPNDPLHIQFSGAGAARQLVLRPAPNQFGIANITLTVTDPNDNPVTSTSTTFRAIVDTAPTITTIANQTVPQNGSTPALAFTVSDAESPPAFLTLSPSSGNTALVPNTNIVLSAINQNTGGATVTVTTAPNQIGTAAITVTVTDPQGLTGSTTFNVTVTNTPPTISSINGGSVQIPANGTSSVLPFTVNDVETPAAQLTLAASSSNTALIPVANVVFGGSGSSRTVQITPAANLAGSAIVTVTVTDGQGGTASTSINVTVVNTPPTITSILDQVILVNQSTGDLGFTVGDAESPATSLAVTATSDNPTLAPAGGIVVSGTGANRSVRVTPAANQSGPTKITVTVTDPIGASTSTSFNLTVKPNTAPTISRIPDQFTRTNQPSQVISFLVNDAETPAAQLVVTATSSNQTLVPNGNIFLGGSGTNRTMFIVPANNQSGTTVITVSVSDGQLSTSTSFNFTVQGAPVGPTISSIPDQTTAKNKSTAPIPFTVIDSDSNLGVDVTATSSDESIVPSSQIFITGTATSTSRTITVTPAFNAIGTATITLLATDRDDRLTATTSFKVTVQVSAASFDFNGDGHNDIVFEDANGNVGVWFMNGTNQVATSFLNPPNVGDPKWQIVGAGDFNGDGKPDLLFQHADTSLGIWIMNGINRNAAIFVSIGGANSDTNWQAVAVGDINGDGKPDILFQHTNGSLAAWLMDGATVIDKQFLSPVNPGDTGWRLVGVGDFDGDKKTDLLFEHTDGSLAVWLMNGLSIKQPMSANALFLNPASVGDPHWRVASVVDLNGDGQADIVFQFIDGVADGTLGVWYMGGINRTLSSLLNPPSPGGTWRVLAP